MAATCRRHHIALYNGVFVRHDAISDSVRHKLEIVSALGEAGVPVEAVVFTHHSDSTDPAVHRGRGAFDVLASHEFWQADLHWYEFGIAYDLFNTMFVVPAHRPILGVYHNVTPLELVSDPKSRTAVLRSRDQRHNFELADHVACVSELNRQDLLDAGVAAERLSLLHLPPAVPPTGDGGPARRPPRPDEPVHLLFVGRFVRAKGLVDLVEAVGAVLRRGVERFDVTLVGNPAFADEPTGAELESLRRRHALSQHLVIAGRVEQDQLAELYDKADALVMPSHHEGYCVPVIEAFGRGCFVIASSAGNLPAVVGGLGTLVAPGDVSALADAIERFVRAAQAARTGRSPLLLDTAYGPLPEDAWRRRVADHLEGHSLGRYRRGVLDLLGRFLPEVAAHPAWDGAVAHLTADGVAAGAA